MKFPSTSSPPALFFLLFPGEGIEGSPGSGSECSFLHGVTHFWKEQRQEYGSVHALSTIESVNLGIPVSRRRGQFLYSEDFMLSTHLEHKEAVFLDL